MKNSFHKPVRCAGNLGPTGAAVESLKRELTIQIRAGFLITTKIKRLGLVYLKDSNAASHFVNSLILSALSRTA